MRPCIHVDRHRYQNFLGISPVTQVPNFAPLIGNTSRRIMRQEVCGRSGRRTTDAALDGAGLCVPSVPPAGTAEASPTQRCTPKRSTTECACAEYLFACCFVDPPHGTLVSRHALLCVQHNLYVYRVIQQCYAQFWRN